MLRRKPWRIFVEVCRVLLALTFIFSGFVKSVDPWGTAIKIGEYLTAFDMEWIYSWRFFLSIWLTGAEMMLGLMILFKVRLRLTSIFAFASMIFFTALTLVLAIWEPVEDCGCFGDAIKLTNWETFIKNMFLLPMSFILFWDSRRLPIMPTWRDLCFMVLFGTIAFGTGLYSFRHLPIIDFLPYKIGTNLVEAMKATGEGEVETVLRYKDRITGQEHEFELSDTTWYDESRWEFVDTKNKAVNPKVHASVRDFAIFDRGEVITDRVINDPGTVYMICLSDPADLKPKCERKLANAARQAYELGWEVMCLTSEPISEYPEMRLDDIQVKCYNMDATTMKTMLRAKVGVVVLHDGVIVDKSNCRDMSDYAPVPQYGLPDFD